MIFDRAAGGEGIAVSAEFKPEDSRAVIHMLKVLFVTEGGVETVELMKK